MALEAQIDGINSKEDLADFISALNLDLRNSRHQWENPTLEQYLDAMERWIRDIDGYYANKGQAAVQQPSWRTLAEILIASKMYE